MTKGGQIRYQVGFDIQQQNLNKLKSSLQQLQKLSFKDLMKINNADIQKAHQIFNDIQNDAQNVENALKQAFNVKLGTVNIETFNSTLKKSGSSIESIYDNFKKAGVAGENAFRDLTTSVLSTNIQLKETHKVLDKMAETFANTIKWNIASTAVNGVTRSIQQAWGYVKDLDTSLNDIRVVTGKSADEMANFAVKANNAAKVLGQTTTDYTNAALIYAQQGLSDKEIEERAKITLKAANVTGQSTSDVSEQLTAVWNGYKVTAEQAELYVDRLAAVAATTASNLEELSTGMSKVASAAAAMGVGEEQLAAQLSTIISATRQAPESVGTALRTVYARISDIKAGIDEDGVTLGNYSGKMADLGFRVLDVNGNLRDMGEVIEEIGGRWQNLTREQQVNLAQTMAGQRQYNNLLALFDNFEKYNQSLNVAQNAAGTLQKQQDIYTESTAAYLKTLKASVEDVYDSLIDTKSINPLIDALSKLAQLVAQFIDSLGGGGAVLRTLGSIGLTVFSEQIAKGLNTTITNLEISKDNVRQFDQALEATKEWQGIPGLDEVSKKLLVNREQLLELARLMTPEQFSGMQTMLNELTETMNTMGSLNAQSEMLNGIIKDVTTASDKWQGLNQILQDDSKQKIIITRISEQEQAFLKTSTALDNYQKQLKHLGMEMINENNVSQNLDKMRSSLTSYMDQVQQLVDRGQMERHAKEVAELGAYLQQLPNDLPEDQLLIELEVIGSRLRGMTKNAGAAAAQLRQKLETEFQGTAESLAAQAEDAENKAETIAAKFNQSIDKTTRAVTIEGFAKMVGSFAQIGNSIRQIQNLGSIWKNADLTSGQKLLQTITNLGTSLPMAISGFKQLQKVTGWSNVAMGWIGGLTAVISVIGMVVNAYKEARQAAINANNEIIDSENKKQEELKENKKLVDSLQELNEQYKNQEISRLDLKNAVEDLIDQYNLEDSTANKLRQSYAALGDQIERIRRETAEAGRSSAIIERDAAITNLEEIAKKQGYSVSNKKQTLTTTLAKTARGVYDTDEQYASKQSVQLIEMLKSAGFEQLTNYQLSASIHFDAESISNFYDQLQDIYTQAEQNIDPDILKKSKLYKSLNEWLKEMQPSITRYKAAIKDLSTYETQLLGLDTFNSNTVNNAMQFIERRNELINEIQKSKNIQTKDAAALADAYIRENYRTLYTEFNDYSTIIDKFKNKFGEVGEENQETINGIIKQMSELDPDHMGKLMDIVRLHPQIINNWDQLRQIIEKITGLDLSNVAIKSPLQDATAQYNTYQSVEDAVRSGKTISPETYEQLDPNIQAFFNMTIDGTYKMEGVAKDFFATVNNFKLQPFENRIKSINQELEHWNNIKEDGVLDTFDDSLIDSAWTQQLQNVLLAAYNNQDQGNAARVLEVTKTRVSDQLNYLEQIAAQGSELATVLLPAWREALSENFNGLNQELATAIAQAVQNNQYEDNTAALEDEKYLTGLTIASSAQSIQELRELRDIIGDQAFTKAAIDLDKVLDIQNLDPEELSSYADHLQQVADEVPELSNELEENDQAAQIVAKSIMKMNDAIETLSNNWEDWLDIFENSSKDSEEYARAMDQAQATVADLLDVSQDYISNDFITDHLNDITDAANGSEIAIDELKSALTADIVAKIAIDNGLGEQAQAQISADILALQNLIPDNLEIGAQLKDEGFVEAANQLLADSKMTVDQANALFDSLGFEAHFRTDEKMVHQKVPRYVTQTTVIDQGFTDDGKPITTTATSTHQDGFDEFDGIMEVAALATNSNTPQIDYITKKAGSSFSNFSSRNTGGNTGGFGGRSSGGGSGKSSGPDTSKKDTKNPAKDTRDIYHDINIELKQIDRQLDRVQKRQDRLYGKALLDNLTKQQELLNKHKKTLEEKQKLQQWDLKNQRQALENLDVTFDVYGNISNYMTILGEKQAAVNAKTKEYNALVQQYNALTDKDAKKQIADQMEAVNKQLKAAEDDYKDLQDKIKNYDSLREDMEDLVDDIEEETQKDIEIRIKKFNMEVEIRLDMGEAERDWNKFRREVLNHTNVLKDTDFDKIFADAQLNADDITSYFNIGNAGTGSVETLTNQIFGTLAELQSIDTTGNSNVYGDNKAQAMEDLQNYTKELMEQMQDIEGLIDDIDEAYLNTIDDIDKNFDKQIEDYEFVGELIEHDIDLLTLLYGDKQYEAMDKYYTAIEENNNKQLDSLRKQRDFWKIEWDAAVARGDTKAAEEFEKNYKDTIKNLNSLIDDSAKNLQAKYENAINGIFDALDRSLTGGQGTDYISMEWDLMHKNADEYLDTINSAFAIQDTERKYQQAINDTKNIKNQQSLKKLMDEQVEILKNKQKITEYDVERAQRLLQVEQARIALEDARAAKTTMRLKRDSQGNYTYQYMADGDEIDDARGKLAAAQQDLYNFDKEAYRNNLNDMLSAWKDFQSEYKKIMLDTSLSDEERTQRLKLLQDEYGEYINGKTQQNNDIRQNLAESAFDAVALLYENDQAQYSEASDAKVLKTQQDSAIQKDAINQAFNNSDLYNEDAIAAEGKSTEKTNALIGDASIIDGKIKEMFGNFATYYTDDEGKVKELTGNEKALWLGENGGTEGLLPQLTSGIQTFANSVAGKDGFIPACTSAFNDLNQATIGYQVSLAAMAEAAGLNLGDVKSGVDNLALSMSTLIEDNDALIDRMMEQLYWIGQLKTKVLNLMDAYGAVFDAANKAAEAVHKYRQEQQQAAAADAAKAAQDASNIAAEAAEAAKKAADTIKEISETADDTDTMSEYERLIEGLAGSVWSGAWANGEERVRRMMQIYGTQGQDIYNDVQDKINNGFDYTAAEQAHNWDYYKQFDYKPINNNVSTPSTKTIIPTIVAEAVTSSVQTAAASKSDSLNVKMQEGMAETHNRSEQTIYINANFPGVNTRKDIEQAFDNITNEAAQRRNKIN